MNKQDFAQLLEMHDWYYDRSEDPRVYKKGAEQRKTIFRIKAQLGEDGEYLYLKYAKKYEENIDTPKSNRMERVMRGIMCNATGKIGFLVDKSANGFLEVKFKDSHRTEFLRQADVTIID